MNAASEQGGAVRFCVNNYGRHSDTLRWMTHYKSRGWEVQLVGCMSQCCTCRTQPMCLENDDWEPKELGARAERA